MKELKELLGEELFELIKEKLGDQYSLFVHKPDEKVVIDDGKSIPYHRFEEVIAKNNTLKEQLAKREQELQELNNYAKGNEDLKKKLEELQTQAKKFEDEYAQKEIQLKKQLLLKESLLNEGVIDAEARDLLLNKFDLNKIELDNDKIKNFNEIIMPIKNNPTLGKLFGSEFVKGKTPEKGNAPVDLLTREQVERMSQEEVLENYELIEKSMAHWNK